MITCSASDKTVKIFDVSNFDLINMIRLDFNPNCCELADEIIFVTENNKIFVIDEEKKTH